MNVVRVKVAELFPAARNPNRMSAAKKAALASSMQANGYLQPIITATVRGRREILDGHHREEVLLAEEVDEVDIVDLGTMTPERADMLRISLRAIHGDMQLSMVEEILRDLQDNGEDLLAVQPWLGFSETELAELLAAEEPEAPRAAPPSVDEPTADKPFVLELKYSDGEVFRKVKRALRKASGRAKDEATGLLAILDLK